MHGIDLEANFITKYNVDKIWRYLNNMNVNTAKTFYLYYILDMTFKEISEKLDIKESTIKTNFYRALKDIKNNFKRGDRSQQQKTSTKIF